MDEQMLVWKGRAVRVRLPKVCLRTDVSQPRRVHTGPACSGVAVQTRPISPEAVSISMDDIMISIPDAVLWDGYVARMRESTLESLGIPSRSCSDFSSGASALQQATSGGWVHDWSLPAPSSFSPPSARVERTETGSDTAAEVATARVDDRNWSRESTSSGSSVLSPTHAIPRQLAVPLETPKGESSAKRLSRVRPPTPYMNPRATAFTPTSSFSSEPASTVAAIPSGALTNGSNGSTVKVIRPPETDVLAKMQSLQIDMEPKYSQPSIHHSLHPFGLGISPDIKTSRTPAPSLAMVPPLTGFHEDEAQDYFKAQLARLRAPTPVPDAYGSHTSFCAQARSQG